MDVSNNGVCVDHPRRPLDYVTVSLIGIAVVPFILANIVLFINRSYPPIKTKSVDLTVLSSMGGLIWIASTIVIFDHLGRPRGFFTVCSLWTFWLQVCFGFGLWLNSFVVRLINLYRIFILRKCGYSYPILPLLLMLFPLIVFCIVATITGGSRFQVRSDTKQLDCVMRKGYPIFIMVIFAVYFTVFLALAIRLRNIMAQFNEFRIIRNGGCAALLLYILTIAILASNTNRQVSGRCFCTLAVASAVFYSFWARNGIPVYQVIFRKEAYASEFREQLRLHQESFNRDEAHVHDESAPIPDRPTEAEQPRTDNMEALLNSLMEELKEQKDRVKELEALIPSMKYQRNSMPAHMSTPVVLTRDKPSTIRSKSLSRHGHWSDKLARLHNGASHATSSGPWSLSKKETKKEGGVRPPSDPASSPSVPLDDRDMEVGVEELEDGSERR